VDADELAGVYLRPVDQFIALSQTREECFMSSHEHAARYLSPAEFGFWRWSDDGEVIEWAGGGTIVFRAQLRQIVEALSADGLLPPFNSLLMLLAACRADWRGSPRHLGQFAKRLAIEMQKLEAGWLKSLAWKLDAISALPDEWRSTTSGRITLAHAIFDSPIVPMPEAFARSVAELLVGNSTKLFADQSGDQSADPWKADLILLSRWIDRADLDRLEELKRTGTDLLPTPAEIDEPEFTSMRQLLGSIENDEELAGLASLARHVMAGLSLPRPLNEQDEIPVGGVSDITNRGPFDRLLVSELANDDDVLMTRVALNEALYLRREAPPKAPPDARIVIFDAGIRMWGIPRLFGTAVGLALGATSRDATKVRFFRAEGNHLAPVSLQSRAELIDHLEVLRHEAHVGAALPEVASLTRNDEEAAAVILVTSREASADPEFRQSLADAGLTGLHLATVNRQGEFELTQQLPHGTKQLAAQRLAIDEILEPTTRKGGSKKASPAVQLLRPEYDPELPAILSVDPFPFRLPHTIPRGRAWEVPDVGVASITSDGRLMLWDESAIAARQLSDCIPPGDVLYRSGSSDGSMCAVVRGGKGVFLIRADAHSPDVSSQWLASKSLKAQAACEHNGRLMLIRKGEIECFDPVSGEFLQDARIPRGVKWRNGRFFTHGGMLSVLSHTGLSPKFEDVFPPDFKVACTGGFDSRQYGGPVGLTLGGALVTCDRQTILTSSDFSIPPPFKIVDVSHNGDEVLLESTRTHEVVAIRISESRCSRWNPGFARSSAEPLIYERSVRSRFRGFAISPGPRLAFWNRSGKVWEFAFHPTSGLIRVQLATTVISSHPGTSFDPLRPCLLPGDRRYQLRVAADPNGNRIYADSRGMVHLRSANLAIPELSFVILDDGELACWSSDGTLVGPPYLVSGRGTDERSPAGQDSALQIRRQLNRFLDSCQNSPAM
jgi:hypothetical protein